MTDLEISQALKIIDRTLEPERLNKVQELILRECWFGKIYQEIAVASGYDSDYVRVVGARMWQAPNTVCCDRLSCFIQFRGFFRRSTLMQSRSC